MLNARITTLRDEERRRIARESHDSVGQLLAAISMNSVLVQEESHKLSPDAAMRVSDNASMIAEATRPAARAPLLGLVFHSIRTIETVNNRSARVKRND